SLVVLVALLASMSLIPAARDAMGIPSGSLWLVQGFLGVQVAAILVGVLYSRIPRDKARVRALCMPVTTFLVYGSAILDLFLIGKTVISAAIALAWFGLLLIPALSLLWLWIKATEKHAPTEAEPEASAGTDKLTQPPSTQSMLRSVLGSLWLIVFVLLWLGLLGFGFLVGGIAFDLLQRVLFEQAVFSPDILPAITRTNVWSEGLAKVAITASVGAGVMGLYLIGQALFLSLSRPKSERFRRALNTRETDFIEAATSALDEYNQAQTYPGIWAWSPGVLGVGGVMVGMLLCMAAGYGVTYALHQIIIPNPPEADWLIRPENIGPGTVLAVFAGIILVWPAWQIAFARSRRFAEYLYLRQGWNTMSGGPRDATDFKYGLTQDIRLDRISALSKFDPASYIQSAFQRATPTSRKLGALAIAITAAFVVLDGLSYQAVTRDHIYQSGYLSLARNTFIFEDAERIETSCFVGHRDGRQVLNTRYALIMPNGAHIRLNDLMTPSRLDILEEIDRRALAGGAEAAYAQDTRTSAEEAATPGSDCLDQIRLRFGDDEARVRALLRF
ncbi:MAG: hypothetical protein NXI03_04740, partial [Alphaproteobacteria bacterium]|nr:hypothetical protein [Alphaproteobacteria bacterium]